MSEVLTHKVPMKHRLDAHIQDVLIVAPVNNDVLTYELATLLWKNKPVVAGAHAPTHQTGAGDPLSPFTGNMVFNTNIGIGAAAVANKRVYMQMLATDTYALHIDQEVNDCTANVITYGIYMNRHGALPNSNVGRDFQLWYGLLRNDHNLVGAFAGMAQNNYGFYDIISNYGSFPAGANSGRFITAAFAGYAEDLGDDLGSGTTDKEVFGLYFQSYMRAAVDINKAAGALTLRTYGVYALASSLPTWVAGAITAHETFGVYASAVANTVGGASVAYGVYASASGANFNYDFYAVGSSLRLAPVAAAPVDAPAEGTMRFYTAAGVYRIYIYLNAGWRLVALA